MRSPRSSGDLFGQFFQGRWLLPGAWLVALATLGVRSAWSEDVTAGSTHWAYQPLRDGQPPAFAPTAWPRGTVDAFILAALDARGMHPTVDADAGVLCRRVCFVLTGLPPTPEELEEFHRDDAPDAFSRLVDRLLASPRFGERWGRHWLDVARFGESVTLRGFVYREAWRYRDYVIDAFNHDLPFDDFVREQVAGDLLGGETLETRQRRLVATTFLALGNTNLEQQDKTQLELDVIHEQLDVIAKAFLAQTVSCARCHDHKFDPIPTRDYYALAGILRGTRALEHANVSNWIEVPLRGDHRTPSEIAPRGFLSVLKSPSSSWPDIAPGESGRRELAEWLTSATNPLWSRVIVNRIWHWVFGAGIVRTADNFGTTGEQPSHPELLDHLAGRFVHRGASVKSVVRELVLSRVFSLARVADAAMIDADSDNRWLSRAPRRRLEAECLRDAMLWAAGELSLVAPRGRTFPVQLGADFGFQHSGALRSVYLPAFRNAPPTIFRVFDAADSTVVTGVRQRTTGASQALFFLNDPLVRGNARAAAQRLLALPASHVGERLERTYLRLLGRLPTPAEAQFALAYLDDTAAESAAVERWTEVVAAIFGSLDFRFLD